MRATTRNVLKYHYGAVYLLMLINCVRIIILIMEQFPTKNEDNNHTKSRPQIVRYMDSSRKLPTQAGKTTFKEIIRPSIEMPHEKFDMKQFNVDVEQLAMSCVKRAKPLKGIYSQEWAEKLGAPKKKTSIPYPKLMQLRKEQQKKLALGAGEDSAETSLVTYKKTERSKGTRFKQKFIKNVPNGGWWVDQSNPMSIHRGSNGTVKLNRDDFKKMTSKRTH